MTSVMLAVLVLGLAAIAGSGPDGLIAGAAPRAAPDALPPVAGLPLDGNDRDDADDGNDRDDEDDPDDEDEAPATSRPAPTTEPTSTTEQPAPTTEPTPTTEQPAPTTEPTPTTEPIEVTEPPSVVPESVVASQTVVGPGGQVTFDGRCDGDAATVVAWVTGSERTTVDTGLSGSSWRYGWTAPVDEASFGSFTFRFWCGDPADLVGDYPASLDRTVDMVLSLAPPVAPPAPVRQSPSPTIPATS